MLNKGLSHLQRLIEPHKSLLNSILKLAIFVLLAVALYKQLFHKESVQALWNTFIEQMSAGKGIFLLLIALFLAPANWLLESEKWRRLMLHLQRLDFAAAFEAVLSSVTLGFFTPNRVGEFGGRILYLKKENRWQSILVSLVGSLAQIAATLVVGFLSAAWYLSFQPLEFKGLKAAELQVLSILAAVLVLLAYAFHRQLLNGLLRGFLPRKLSVHRRAFNNLGFNDLNMAFWYSMGRHLVFTAQYLLLLMMYGINLQAGEALSALGLIFLAQIVLPTFALFEVVKRGSISVFFLGAFTGNEIGIIAASTSLWLINVVLPAIFGYAFLAKKDFASALGAGSK